MSSKSGPKSPKKSAKKSPKKTTKRIKEGAEGLNSYMRRMVKNIKKTQGLEMRVGDETLAMLPQILEKSFEEKLTKAVLFATHAKRKTVMETDVEAAFGKAVVMDEPVMAKATFERYVRQLAGKYGDGLRFSEKTFSLLQSHYESVLVRLLVAASHYARSKGQKTILPEGIKTVLELQKDICK